MLRYRLSAVFDKVDRLAGLGNYAILLLGFSDSTNFSTPVTRGEDTELLYTQPYSQKHVEILELETNANSPRFGLPTKYRIKLREPLQNVATGVSNVTTTFNYIDVHYSRVVHVAENAMDNNVIGTPRLEGVYNLLDDLEKVVGGTSETFWLASYKGMQIDVDKDMDMDAESEAALTDEIEEYQHQLRRFIRTRGVKVNDLGSSTPDPKNTFDVIISLISGTTGIPRRILLGSELGQLASDQDRANWSDRIKERRSTFAEPCVLIPFKQRMIEAGILPEMDLGTIEYVWPPNFQLTPLEEAQSQAQRARAIINLAKHFKEEPLCTKSEARSIVGLSPEIPADLPERTVDVKADDSADINAPDSDSDSDSAFEDDIDEPAINDTVE